MRAITLALLLLTACGGRSVDIGDAGAWDDTDGDGIRDRTEGISEGRDSDGDGVPDYLDDDSDGDGIPDAREAGDDDLRTPPADSDYDETPDYLDLDSDDNGLPDEVDGVGDLDGDGWGDWIDRDDDDDRYLDREEGSDASPPVDTDGDGTPDHRDLDSDGDTIADVDDRDLYGLGVDADRDGALARVDLDSDGDGVPDAVEAGDADLATRPVDSDFDGQPDFLDVDSDEDAVLDADEPPGGRLNRDLDDDGAPDGIEVAAGTDPLDASDEPLADEVLWFAHHPELGATPPLHALEHVAERAAMEGWIRHEGSRDSSWLASGRAPEGCGLPPVDGERYRSVPRGGRLCFELVAAERVDGFLHHAVVEEARVDILLDDEVVRSWRVLHLVPTGPPPSPGP
ncbi:MAG: hypothetical protein VYE22_25375 [Myxococcota bacterium]|nr:hypothetical protein [Myxococcota bacterium]